MRTDNMNLITLGKNIQEIRQSLNMTQEKFSENLNITPNFLSKVENGNAGISIDVAIKICNLANCSANILFKNIVTPSDIPNKYDLLNKRDKSVIEKMIDCLLDSEYH